MLSREQQVVLMSRPRIGHNRLNSHMYRQLKLAPSLMCTCGQDGTKLLNTSCRDAPILVSTPKLMNTSCKRCPHSTPKLLNISCKRCPFLQALNTSCRDAPVYTHTTEHIMQRCPLLQGVWPLPTPLQIKLYHVKNQNQEIDQMTPM